nr:putative ribonuclease H-like domain-containing protein [Tanacetum cinerariifolium]
MSMNYQPVFAGNQTNGNAGTKANIDVGQAGKKTVPGPQYVLLLLLTSDSQDPNSSKDKVADAGKKSIKVLRKENRVHDPAKEGKTANTNITNRLNTVSSPVIAVSSSFTTVDQGREKAQRNEFESMFGQDKDANGNRRFTLVNAARSSYIKLGGSIPVNAATLPNAGLSTDPLISNLEDTGDLHDTGIFSGAYDYEVDGAMVDFNNLKLITFRLQKVWRLVDLPKGKHAIGTKWVYENKKDGRGIVVRNKARLVTQGYTQEEGIDYDEVFALIARIEAIMLFFAYASFMRFIVHQMDMKSAFLYGTIEEEVYMYQPPSFEYPHFSNKVYKVEKALYGLHQAPIALYETLSTYLLENGFRRGIIDKTLFIKKDKCDILLVQVFQVTPKVSHLYVVKRIFRYLKGQPKLSLWYPKDSPFDLEAFSDSDYAEASLDRKSTIGGYIKYALTVNPTVYTSCIEQFWATAKVKNVNGETHIQAIVDKKKVIITEASIRRDLSLTMKEG